MLDKEVVGLWSASYHTEYGDCTSYNGRIRENVGLGGCLIMECLLPYLSMVTVPHIMVGLERFHCTINFTY